MNDGSSIIEPHGGYRSLKAYQTTEIIYDGTVKFCERFIDPRSRTTDQMIQSARSGKQNIAERLYHSRQKARSNFRTDRGLNG